MRKVLIGILLLGVVFSGGCQLATSVGGSLVEGAAEQVAVIAEAKNRDTLLQAVEAGAAVGLTAADIDKNGDGLMDQEEALGFGVAYARARGGETANAVIAKLQAGDLAGVKQEIEAAKNSGIDWLQMIGALIATAIATYKARDFGAAKRYKKAVDKS